jgi:hypothetical protein
MNIFNVIHYGRGTGKGVYPFFEWQAFIPNTVCVLRFVKEEREANRVLERSKVWRFFLKAVFFAWFDRTLLTRSNLLPRAKCSHKIDSTDSASHNAFYA